MALVSDGSSYTNNYGRNDAGAQTSFPTGDFTVALWVKHTGAHSSIETMWQFQTGGAFELLTNSGGTFYVRTAAGATILTGGVATADTWVFVAVTKSGSNYTIYRGTEGGAASSVATGSNAQAAEGSSFRIFSDDFDGYSMKGAIAYPRVWGSALSSGAVESERTSTSPVAASPFAYWDFSTAGATITDSSGNGRTITKAGTVTTTTDPSISAGPTSWGRLLGMEINRLVVPVRIT